MGVLAIASETVATFDGPGTEYVSFVLMCMKGEYSRHQRCCKGLEEESQCGGERRQVGAETGAQSEHASEEGDDGKEESD